MKREIECRLEAVEEIIARGEGAKFRENIMRTITQLKKENPDYQAEIQKKFEAICQGNGYDPYAPIR